MSDIQRTARQARTLAARLGAHPLNGTPTLRHYCDHCLSLDIDLGSAKTWISIRTAPDQWTPVLDLDASGQLHVWATYVQPIGCDRSWIDILSERYAALPKQAPLTFFYYQSIIRFWHDTLACTLNQTLNREAALKALHTSLLAAVAFIEQHPHNLDTRELLLQARTALALASGNIQIDCTALVQEIDP